MNMQWFMWMGCECIQAHSETQLSEEDLFLGQFWDTKPNQSHCPCCQCPAHYQSPAQYPQPQQTIWRRGRRRRANKEEGGREEKEREWQERGRSVTKTDRVYVTVSQLMFTLPQFLHNELLQLFSLVVVGLHLEYSINTPFSFFILLYRTSVYTHTCTHNMCSYT